MRLQTSTATAVLVAVLISSSTALAQFNYTAQNRRLSANAHTVGFPQLGIDDLKAAASPDFSEFNQSITATAINNDVATATASQNSQLAATIITASGAATSKGYRITGTQVGFTDSASQFSATFVLSAPADVQVTAQLMAHRGVMTNFSDTIGSSSFSLVGGPTAVSTMTTIPDLQSDSSVSFSQALSLSAGIYVVTASASSNSGTPNLTNVVNGSKLTSNASYSISVNIVPEPSSIILMAGGLTALACCVIVSFPRVWSDGAQGSGTEDDRCVDNAPCFLPFFRANVVCGGDNHLNIARRVGNRK